MSKVNDLMKNQMEKTAKKWREWKGSVLMGNSKVAFSKSEEDFLLSLLARANEDMESECRRMDLGFSDVQNMINNIRFKISPPVTDEQKRNFLMEILRPYIRKDDWSLENIKKMVEELSEAIEEVEK